MRRELVLAALALTLPGVGCGGQTPSTGSQHPGPDLSKSAARAGHTLDSFSLPRIGVVAATCRVPGPFTVRFTADPRSASTVVKVRVGRGSTSSRTVNPGKTLVLHVPAAKREVASDLVFQTPRILWRMKQSTEPHTIKAVTRLVLRNGDEGAKSCTFQRLRTALTTSSNSG